jgi:hypothetical protein
MSLPRPAPFPNAAFADNVQFPYSDGPLTPNGGWTTGDTGHSLDINNVDACPPSGTLGNNILLGAFPLWNLWGADWDLTFHWYMPFTTASTARLDVWFGDKTDPDGNWLHIYCTTTTGQNQKATLHFETGRGDTVDTATNITQAFGSHSFQIFKRYDAIVVTVDATSFTYGTLLGDILTPGDMLAKIEIKDSGAVATAPRLEFLAVQQYPTAFIDP